MALAAYRTLLRSARIAFQGMLFSVDWMLRLTQTTGDARTLIGARIAAREGFEKERHLPADSDEAAKKIHYAQDVARILRENVIQGKATKEDPMKLRLNIHDQIELGDNDSVKKTVASGKKSNSGACCSS